jgi:hypothetical protein
MSNYLQGNSFEIVIDRPLLSRRYGFQTRSRELQNVVDAIKQYVKEPTAANITQVSKRLQIWKMTKPEEYQHRFLTQAGLTPQAIEDGLRQELKDAYDHLHLTYHRYVRMLVDNVGVLEGTVDPTFQALMTALTGNGNANLAGGFQAASNAITQMQGHSATAQSVFEKVAHNSRGETVVIVPMTGGGGGFIHKEKVQDVQKNTLHVHPDCRVNYISWEPAASYPAPAQSMEVQPAYKLACLNGAAVKNKFGTNPPEKISIHLKAGVLIVDSYPAEIVLMHEIGHAFQYIYGRNMYLKNYGDPVNLDAMNITYVERPMLKELGSSSGTLYRLRSKYGGRVFPDALLDGATNWGYDKVHSPAELPRLRNTLKSDAIYNPSFDPAYLQGHPHRRRELTAAADYYVPPAPAAPPGAPRH